MRNLKLKIKNIAVVVCCLVTLFVPINRTYAIDNVGLNKKVLAFAISKLGKTVNNGNCWVFPRDALVESGGRFPGPRGSYPTTVFGRPINIFQLKPGDIIHFRYAVFAIRGRVYAWTAQDHYAIVEYNSGYEVWMIHQNWAGKRYVMRGYINLYNLVSGNVTLYRPQVW